MSASPKNRGNWLGCIAVVSWILFSLSSQAQAAAITYNYTGNVISAIGRFAGQGSVVTGTFTFDDRMLDWSDNTYRDEFKYVNPDNVYMTMGATVNVGTFTVVIDRPTEHVGSGVDVTDGHQMLECNDMLCDIVSDAISFQIHDYFTSVFTLDARDESDTAIAAGAGSLTNMIAGLIDIFDHLDLGLFPDYSVGYVGLGSWEDPHDELQFTWTGVSRVQDEDPAPVPEPATFSLLGLGLAGLGAMRRKQKAA